MPRNLVAAVPRSWAATTDPVLLGTVDRGLARDRSAVHGPAARAEELPVGGLPDVVIDGQTGWLVPPRDPRVIASTMLAALSDRQEGRRRAHAGRDLVHHLFDVRRTAAEIADIYRVVLGQATSPSRDAGETGCTLASSA